MSYTDNSSPYTVNKLVSVIVPTFNDTLEDLLQTVNSVLLQTHNNLELIVVDDGSVIPFADINFLVDDKRVRFVHLYNNCGVAHARNQGISRARGEYIAFLDTGDWWESRKLEKQLKKLLKSYGVEEISAIGEEFDPNLHEAVAMVDVEDANQEEIIEVVRRGYFMDGELLRPAQVKVAK